MSAIAIDACAPDYDLCMPHGATRVLTVTVTDRATGDPVNLTGHTLTLSARYGSKAGTLLIDARAVTLRDQVAEPGLADVTILPADTSSLPRTSAHRLECSFDWTGTSGQQDVAAEVRITVEPTVR